MKIFNRIFCLSLFILSSLTSCNNTSNNVNKGTVINGSGQVNKSDEVFNYLSKNGYGTLHLVETSSYSYLGYDKDKKFFMYFSYNGCTFSSLFNYLDSSLFSNITFKSNSVTLYDADWYLNVSNHEYKSMTCIEINSLASTDDSYLESCVALTINSAELTIIYTNNYLKTNNLPYIF